MIKFIPMGSHDRDGTPRVHIAVPHRTQVKVAADITAMPPAMAEFWINHDPDPDNFLYAHINIVGAFEYWGCFPEGNMVISADGIVKDVSEIAIEDRFISHKNRPKVVKEIFSREYEGEIYTINAAGTPDTTCTPNHQFWAIPRDQLICAKDRNMRCTPETFRNCSRCEKCDAQVLDLEPRWIRADELKKNDVLLIPRYNPKRFADPIHIDYARLMGLYLAEGSITKDSKGKPCGIELDFHEDETVLRDEVISIADRLGISWGVYPQQDSKSIRVLLFSVIFAGMMQKWCGEYSDKKKIAPQIFNQRDEFIKDVIGGYLDGDGHVVGRSGGACIRSSSKTLLLQVKQLLFRLGCNSSWHWNDDPVQPDDKKVSPYGQIYIRHTDVQILSGHSEKVDRCQWVPKAKNDSRSFEWNGFYCIPVRAVSHEYRECTVYNCEVASDHSYVVNFVSVHNSNNNADAFLEKDIYDDPCYKTFMSAKPYLLHNNKNPKFGIGDVIFADYNTKMHRIELISALDRNDTKATEIEVKINSGDFPDVSMGCRVTADKCHICGNMAKTRAEYCDHLMNHMLQYWPYDKPQTTGKITCAENPNPDFFDQSFVFTRADKSSNVMQKLAYEMRSGTKPRFLFSADLGEALFYKLAEEKKDADEKDAEIEKPSPDDITKDIPLSKEQKEVLEEDGKELVTKQPDLPIDTLKELAEEEDEDIFSTAGLMGIRIEPKEYTIIRIIRSGQNPAAKALSKRTIRIEIPKLAADEEIAPMPVRFNHRVASILRPHLEERSFHIRFASMQTKFHRAHPMILYKEASKDTFPHIEGSREYRRNIMARYKSARQMQSEYFGNAELLNETHGNVDAFMKTGCVPDNTMLHCLAKMAGPTIEELASDQ